MERYGLTEEQIEILSQATPKELVRKRKGRGGKEFKFLPHEQVTRILNDAFDHAWSTGVKDFDILEKEVWVLLRLSVSTQKGEIYKEQFGQQDIVANITIGDCLKGAASDALTKCASLLGVALDLYGISANDKPQQKRYAPKITRVDKSTVEDDELYGPEKSSSAEREILRGLDRKYDSTGEVAREENEMHSLLAIVDQYGSGFQQAQAARFIDSGDINNLRNLARGIGRNKTNE